MSNQDVIATLKKALADTQILYFKTHAFHWNVTGPRFHSLHEMFEEQYREIWEAIDIMAERVRSLGDFVANNSQEITENGSLRTAGQTPDADEMVQALAEDNRAIVETLKLCAKAANDNDDMATEDLMIEGMRAHNKAAWMLESMAKTA